MPTIAEHIAHMEREQALDAVQSRLQVAAALYGNASRFGQIDRDALKHLARELRAIALALDVLREDPAS